MSTKKISPVLFIHSWFGQLRAVREKKWTRVFLRNFLGWFFQLFVVKNKNKIWKHCSVRTEKLHRKKVNFFYFFWENFYFYFLVFFLYRLILFWNKSVIHRGPDSMVSSSVSGVNLFLHKSAGTKWGQESIKE